MKKQKAYKFRLYPNLEQRILFEKTFGCSRFIWNQMLADRIAHYEKTGKSLNNTPAQYKEKYPWLKEVDSLALCNVQLNLNKAYKSFYQSGFGFPRFKSKKAAQSYKTNNQKGAMALLDGKIKLPKAGWVKVKVHRQPKGLIKSATISKTATGKYFISILCEEEILPLPKTNSNLGVDLGLENFAILSSGEKVRNPKFLTSLSKKLAREQKVLSRKAHLAKKKGRKLSDCRNYQKQKLKVARIHETISNQRRKAWKQVYTNNENASVEISFEEGCYQKKYSIKAGENSSDNIRKLYNKLNSDSVVYDVKITVSQGKNKLTKVVAITKDNFVRNKVDLNNSQITKVEYRPIEGFARKMFGETGTPEENDETGEIKITLGSSENQNLKKIFEE